MHYCLARILLALLQQRLILQAISIESVVECCLSGGQSAWRLEFECYACLAGVQTG